MSNSAEAEFFTNWTIYQKIVNGNLLCHREMFGSIEDEFKNQNAYSILDLGCGSCDNIIKMLPTTIDINFTGVDTSERALSIAKESFNQMGNVTHTLVCADILSEVEKLHTEKKKFDIIFSSYAIHHFEAKEKKLLFKRLEGLLSKRGKIIIVDIFIPDELKREEFYSIAMADFYLRLASVLTPEEVQLVNSRIDDNDKPEYIAFYQELASEYGLKLSAIQSIKHYFSGVFVRN